MDAPGTSVTLVRIMHVPSEKVFAAWTDPELLQRWLARTAEVDLHIGGQYRLVPDDDQHKVTGQYKEVVPGRRLVMTWTYEGTIAAAGVAESLLTVEFRSFGPTVMELDLWHEHISDAGYRQLLQDGAWTEALDKLEALCSGKVPEPSGSVSDSIEREILIDAPIERVWGVVIQMKPLDGWTGDVDPRPGALVPFTMGGQHSILVRFEKVEPPRCFSYRWATPSYEEPRPGNSTLVEYTLTPEGNGTRLRVVESGFASLAWPDGEKARYAKGNTGGWEFVLNQIREAIKAP